MRVVADVVGRLFFHVLGDTRVLNPHDRVFAGHLSRGEVVRLYPRIGQQRVNKSNPTGRVVRSDLKSRTFFDAVRGQHDMRGVIPEECQRVVSVMPSAPE